MASETAAFVPSPWGKPSKPVQPCSLTDVMSEQLASELQIKEEDLMNQEVQLQDQSKLSEAAAPFPSETEPSVLSSATADNDNGLSDAQLAAKLAAEGDHAITDGNLAEKLAAEEELGYDVNDEVIALMLQKQYDREFDSALSKQEQFYNGNSKVSISYDNYKRKHLQADYQNEDIVDDDEDDFDDAEGPESPEKFTWENAIPKIGPRGYCGQGKNIVTKHDKVICGRKNAQRLMQFPPEFGCGDGEGMDMQLPNKVYNKLKRHSQQENKKGQKVHDKKDYQTAIKAVDEKTRILIFKMINADFLSSVDGVVSEGKEAVIFKGIGGKKDDVDLPKDIILKVYKTSMNEFKTRLKYIHGDYRLSKDHLRKFNPRKLMRMWAEKEYLNLKKMERNHIPCPSALALKKHILVMTCIGGEKPAPKLRDVMFSAADIQDVYEQTIDLMKNIYHKCNMVHSDFSAYNLLWHDGKVWVIDVGQAVDRENKNSTSFLLRDCKNVCDFFKQRGACDVPSAEDLFNKITDYSLKGEGIVFESHASRFEKERYAFDYFFELTKSARSENIDVKLGDEDSNEEDSDSNECSDEYEDEENLENCTTEAENDERKTHS